MIYHSQKSAMLWDYVVFLDERIALAKKQGKDPAALQQERENTIQQITTLNKATPTIEHR